jgi:hypothetical protein
MYSGRREVTRRVVRQTVPMAREMDERSADISAQTRTGATSLPDIQSFNPALRFADCSRGQP